MNQLKRVLVLGGALFVWASSAMAVDGVSIEGGTTAGDDPNTEMWRVGAQWDWKKRWFQSDSGWFLGGYWDTSVGHWNSRDDSGSDIYDFGVTPVFRYQKEGYGPYVEAAIGFHYLSNTDINRTRRFSTHFQFGDHIGVGYRFGKDGAYDIAYRLQHLSNGGIDEPNPGINFHQIRFQYHFQ